MTDKYGKIYSVVLVCLDATKTGVQYKNELGFSDLDKAISYCEARKAENRQEMWEILVSYTPQPVRHNMIVKKAKLDVEIHIQPEYLSKEWYEFCEKHNLEPYPRRPNKLRALMKTAPYTDICASAIMYTGDGIPKFIDPDDKDLTLTYD